MARICLVRQYARKSARPGIGERASSSSRMPHIFIFNKEVIRLTVKDPIRIKLNILNVPGEETRYHPLALSEARLLYVAFL